MGFELHFQNTVQSELVQQLALPKLVQVLRELISHIHRSLIAARILNPHKHRIGITVDHRLPGLLNIVAGAL